MFFTVFIIISLAITMTAYTLSNYILVQKHQELSNENLNYLVKIIDKELEQLHSSFGFFANNTFVLERIDAKYNELSDKEKLMEDRNVTNTLASMSTFDIFSSISSVYIVGFSGEEYWYGFGPIFDEKDELVSIITQMDKRSGGLNYYGVGASTYRLSHNENVIKFSQVLYDRFGRDIGAVYFEMKASYVEELLRNEYADTQTQIHLVDADNTVIYSSYGYEVGETMDVQRLSGMASIRNLSKYNWRLISLTPESKVLEDSDLVAKVTMLTALFSIMIEMLLVFMLTRQIVKPITKLKEGMNKVKEGDFSVRVYHDSNDELGELADDFNTMTHDLEKHLHTIIEQQNELKDSEYQALQAQINPHFMYNSLYTLKWLANLQKADNIVKVIDSLWNLLKISSNIQGQSVTLDEELIIVKNYFHILEVRYKGKFSIDYRIPEDYLTSVLPKYVLQPIVENAVFHGIEPKKGPGIIIISVEEVEKQLHLVVRDNGVGMDERLIRQVLQEKTMDRNALNSIGLGNVHRRLQLLYGNACGLTIESTIGVGTTVTVVIPTS